MPGRCGNFPAVRFESPAALAIIAPAVTLSPELIAVRGLALTVGGLPASALGAEAGGRGAGEMGQSGTMFGFSSYVESPIRRPGQRFRCRRGRRRRRWSLLRRGGAQ